MKINRSHLSMSLLLALGLMAIGPTLADESAVPQSVTVSFGGGLNTAQPGNAHNHIILPKEIRVRVGGVVNLVVAGFHQPMVYKPGTIPANIIVPQDPAALFINDTNNLFYTGLSPVGPSPAGLSNTQNRVESIRFEQPGTYLLLCNVKPHFLDGMYAFIRVMNKEHD